ncbi:MAG: aminotransferase [Planctomycetota bacterium]|nr:MAG: aminotransferase [Planctomycetota bacterium]
MAEQRPEGGVGASGAERARAAIARQRRYLFPAVITYYTEPLAVERAEGTRVWDMEGREYLDFFGGILTVSVGHSHPGVTGAVKDQVERLVHVSTLYVNEPQVLLAEKIASITPEGSGLSCSFFTNSGSEADETAVALAKMATGANTIIGLRHGYAGRTVLARQLTAHAAWRGLDDEMTGVKQAHAPYCYRCPFGQKYPDCGIRCAQDLRELIQTTTPGRIAGFLAETILGVGGFIVPPPEYFQVAVPIVREFGGLFIADEVQAGWGRTGDRWWGIEHYGVHPDIMTTAKGMANGFPIGLTVTRPEIAARWQGLTISTFGGNPVSARAALATIAAIEEQDLRANARRMGERFRQGLLGLQEKYPLIGDVRGMGLMQALELVRDRKTKEPAAAELGRLFEQTRQRGLLIGKGGLYGNVVRLSPPLTVSADEIDRALAVLDASFAAIAG